MLTKTVQTVCVLGMLAAGVCLAADPVADTLPSSEAAASVAQSPEAAPAADTQAPEEAPGPDAKALATVEAISQYCGKLDPAAADRYLMQARLVSQGSTEDALVKVRETNEYQQAHGELDESLAKVEARNARKVCAQLLLQSH